jgi:hypothetical protein
VYLDTFTVYDFDPRKSVIKQAAHGGSERVVRATVVRPG